MPNPSTSGEAVPPKRRASTPARWLTWLGPGLLVAATGVGAGDLATGAFTGTELGTAILWAVLVGAFLKFMINEGLARWQLATGTTFLEGCRTNFRGIFLVLFPLYLFPWTLVTASALMSACGATAHALCPIFENPVTGKQVFGILHSLAGLSLVWIGGYRLFEKLMSVCIGVMFCVVLITVVVISPPPTEIATGLLLPTIPRWDGPGLQWTVALMGGVGGTLTILCYSYWIAEEGRGTAADLPRCRVDLACGYLLTAFFGIGMVIIGSRVPATGSGSSLIVDLAGMLQNTFSDSSMDSGTATGRGIGMRYLFLVGAWSAVFSSLLGVWQSVPYLFADYVRLAGHVTEGSRTSVIDASRWTYRGYLLAMATIPVSGLWLNFKQVQKIYAIFGAAIIPLLALALLLLNGRRKLVGEHRNRIPTTIVLVLALLFFVLAGTFEVLSKWS